MGGNLLLVVFDTARADAFEPYGAAPGATPAVTDLARRGVALPAVAPSSWTVPSHASMLTGVPSRTLGLGQAPGGTPQGCRPLVEAQRDRLLPEVLRRRGWATSGVSANLWVSDHSGFSTGFERWDTVPAPHWHDIGDRSWRAAAAWALTGLRARLDSGAAAVERLVEQWVADTRADGRPFFWFVNLVECHSPYLPPRPYNDLPAWQRVRAGVEARRHLTLEGIWRASAGGFDVPGRALARMRHLYARSVRLMDDWLARVLTALDRHGLLDETVVAVTSDHGENLGEGDLLGHALSLDDRLLRVPLVMAGPGIDRAPAAAGGVVSLVDLPRLVAPALGLDDHPWHDGGGRVPPGVAVAQLDPLAPPDDPRIRKVVADWGVGDEGSRRMSLPLTCATDGRLKVVARGDEWWFHDLAADPVEGRRLPLDGAPALAPLVAAVEDALEADGVVPPTGPPPDLPPDEQADLERRMRLLGYL